MKPCKHGYLDGAMHAPCYRCRSEYWEIEACSLAAEIAARGVDIKQVERQRDEYKKVALENSAELFSLMSKYEDLIAAASEVCEHDQRAAILYRESNAAVGRGAARDASKRFATLQFRLDTIRAAKDLTEPFTTRGTGE